MSENIRDGMTLLGMASIVVGLWWAWPPLAWIGLGVALLAGAMLWARIEKRRNDKPGS